MYKNELLLSYVKIEEYIDFLTEEYDFLLRYALINDSIAEIEETGFLGNRVNVIYNPGEKSTNDLFNYLDRLKNAKMIYEELMSKGINNNDILKTELFNLANILIYNKKYTNVYSLLDMASKYRNYNANRLLAKMLIHGLYDTKKSIGEALNYLKQAADNDDLEATLDLINLYDYDNDYLESHEAIYYTKRAIKLGSNFARERLYLPFDYKSRYDRLNERIDNGDIQAIYDMVLYLEETESDELEKYLNLGLEKKEARCFLYKAKKYYQEKNKDLALEYAKKASNLGSKAANKFIGDLLVTTNFYQFENNIGHEPIPSHVKQFECYLMADMKDEEVYLNIALAYYYGYPTMQSYQTAYNFFLELENKGNVLANYYLGLMYLHGDGIEIDLNKGISYLNKAANLGELKAILKLIDIYSNGYLEIKAKPELLNNYIEMSKI